VPFAGAVVEFVELLTRGGHDGADEVEILEFQRHHAAAVGVNDALHHVG
jgi:hypothetical protein